MGGLQARGYLSLGLRINVGALIVGSTYQRKPLGGAAAWRRTRGSVRAFICEALPPWQASVATSDARCMVHGRLELCRGRLGMLVRAWQGTG